VQGLPLAFVAISGILASKDTRKKDEWDLVRHSLCTEINCNNKFRTLNRVLSLSLDDLPYYFKSCLSQLSVFPKVCLLNCRRLIQLWIAEGFVDKKEGMTVEEVAQDYLNKLLNGSLLEVPIKTSDGRIKYCRIHDFWLYIITSNLSNHGFTETAIIEHKKWSDKIHHPSIQTSLEAMQQKKVIVSTTIFTYVWGREIFHGCCSR